MEACEVVEGEILDAEERVALKRGVSEVGRVMAIMGPKVLRRKKDAMHASPPFLLYTDNPSIVGSEQRRS